jgi:hypothetical protein
MKIQLSVAQENILESLEKLGGWSTITQAQLESGYSEDFTAKTLNDLVDLGILQCSKLRPHLFSLVGKPLIPTLKETTIRLDCDFKPLARAAAHTSGNSLALKQYMTGKISTTISVRILLKLADLAGYDLVLVRRK